MAHHLSRDEVVPPLRTDLYVSAAPMGTGAEVIQVCPVGSSEAMAMHGFEFSIALMLDGRRTADEVIAGCGRLGLPLSLFALDAFVAQLESHGLLGVSALRLRRARTDWSPQVRELFRSALRSSRQEDAAGARAALERLLALAPTISEANRLKRWSDELPGRREDFQHLLRDVRDSWSRSPTIGPQQEVPPGRPPLHIPAWAGWTAVAATLLIAIAVVPFPRIATASARLSPVARLPVFAQAAGAVGTVLVRDGDRVEAGAPLFTWSADDLQLLLLDANERLDAAREPLLQNAERNGPPDTLFANLAAAQTQLARAQSMLLSNQSENEAAQASFPDAAATRFFFAARAEERRATEAIDALVMPDSVQGMRLAGLRFEVRLLEARLEHRTVTAEVAGVVSESLLRAGLELAEGQRLMLIDDREQLELVATLTPHQAQAFSVGDPLVFDIEGREVAGKVRAVAHHEIAAHIANPGGALQRDSTRVQIKREPATLLQLATGR